MPCELQSYVASEQHSVLLYKLPKDYDRLTPVCSMSVPINAEAHLYFKVLPLWFNDPDSLKF